MTLEDAKEIISELLEFHKHDINFQDTTYKRMEQLLQGPEAAGCSPEDYAYECKTHAAVCKYFSPYPEVRAVTEPVDDPSLPVETFRAHILGYIWAVIGQFINSFFNSRFPNITINSAVCQLFLYPCGKACEYILPDWGFTFRGTRHSLNPGPWNYKEQMLSTIIFDVSLTSVYVFSNIQTQEVLYGDTWLTTGFDILLILSTQLMGLGFAGLLRRFAIFPITTYWPASLSTLALNRALLLPDKKENINGWKISRYNFFFITFGAMFLYYWFPGYIFQGLSMFSWMTWIAPENFHLAAVTGTQFGIGLNPIASFDWNVISQVYNPLTLPFFSIAQLFFGTFISGLFILAIYYSKNNYTNYLPLNSSHAFTNKGTLFEVSEVITDGKLDVEKYKAYSPAYLTAGSLMAFGAFFAAYPLTFCYVLMDQWRLVVDAYKMLGKSFWGYIYKFFIHSKRAFQNLFKGNFKGFFSELILIVHDDSSIYDGFDDPFVEMIKKYDEVPDWWFLLVVVVSFVFAIVLLTCFPDLRTPVWTIFFVIGLNVVFLVPMTVMQATTGTTVGLNVLVELIIGYALPGNAEALMFVKAYGYNIDGQATTYVADQKMGHYAKIPPKAVFRGQVISTVITGFVALGVVKFVDNSIEGICTPDQKQHFTCASNSIVYFTSSVIWGLIGPKRIFSEQYPLLKWMFLFGFLLALAWWTIKHRGPLMRAWLQKRLPSWVFTPLNVSLFKCFSLLNNVHPALVIIGMLNWAPYNLAYQSGGLYIGIAFMYYIKRYYTAWWEKYNYVLSAALSGGVAFSAIIVFFAVQYHDKPINWWGNNIISVGIDGGSSDRQALTTDLPTKGYFGMDSWS
ncbi:unnamed protein product [Ambrosiozyma monospora]|uniref:Unnamed protein product n=1 Tax=Ambrosiozyma monospora TaxID=43982 RepID=A0ACB5SUH0_AMBMO|nr:unnamed protein product [Ambrosiozyma monospora]